MSITIKSIIIILSVTVPLFVALFFISRIMIFDKFESFEKDSVEENLFRAEDAIQAKLRSMERMAKDWSNWDDTYNYAQGTNPGFIDVNMMDYTFSSTQLNLMMIFSSSGRPLFAKAYDYIRSEEIDLPAELSEGTFQEELTRKTNDNGTRSGVFLTSEYPLLIVISPILDSYGEGPSAGFFITGAFLDAGMIGAFSETTHLSMAVQRIHDPSSSSDFEMAENLFAISEAAVIRPLDQNRIAGYRQLKDILGTPVLLLRVDMPRDFYAQAKTTVTFVHILLFLISILFIGIFIFILKNMILSRIIILDRSVQNIGKTGDKSKRIVVSGQDEIYRLSSNINNMLESLELADRKIAALYEQEKKHREELEEEAKSRSQFINVLAHELRTPLTPILVSVEMVREVLSKAPDSIQYKLINNAFISADSLRTRLEELLDLARFTRGAFKLNKVLIETGDFMEVICARYKPAIDQKRQQLMVEIQPGLPQIYADPSRLEQVLINLLSNASKYSPENSTITIRTTANTDNLFVEIIDQGIGIPPEEQASLFTPYHRAQQDRQSYPGIGLGLAVCSQIIQAHGGKIWVESKRGEGSSFKFLLPFNPADSETIDDKN
jgi:signal transduction histidine kinase